MRKATAWSVRGVEPATQEIAEEAARRAGMSLGDWLDQVVAEQAAEQGVATEDLNEEDKLDAIGERLARLSRRVDRTGVRRPREEPRVEPRAAAPKPSLEEARLAQERLDAAVAKFESRAAKNEERTAKAFESVASWIERDQVERLEERETLQTVAEKLAAIETRAQRDAQLLREAVAQKSAREAEAESRFDARLDALARRMATPEPAREPRRKPEPTPSRDSTLDERLGDLGRRSAARADPRRAADPALAPTREPARPRFEPESEATAEWDEPIEAPAPPRPPRSSRGTENEPEIDSRRADPPRHAAAAQKRTDREEPIAAERQARDAAMEARLEDLARRVAASERARAEPSVPPARPRLDVRDAVEQISRRRAESAAPAPPPPPVVVSRPTEPAASERPRAGWRHFGVDADPSPASPQTISRVSEPPARPAAAKPLVDDLRKEMAALDARLAKLRGDRDERRPAAADAADLKAELASMSRSVSDLAPRNASVALAGAVGDLDHRLAAARDAGASDRLVAPVEAMLRQLRDTLRERDPGVAASALEREIRGLGAKIDTLAGATVEPELLRRIRTQSDEIRALLAAAALNPIPVERLERQIGQLADRVEHIAASPAPQAEIGRIVQLLGETRAQIERSTPAAALNAIEQRLEQLAARVDDAVRRPAPAADARAIEDLARRVDGVRDSLERRVDERPDLAPLEAGLREISAKLDRAPSAAGESKALMTSLLGLGARLEEAFRLSRPNAADAKPFEDLARRIDTVRATVERQNDFGKHAARFEAALDDIGAKLDRPPPAAPESPTLALTLRDLNAKLEEAFRRPPTVVVDPRPIEDLARRVEAVRATVERQAGPGNDSRELKVALADIGAKLDRVASAPVPPPPKALDDMSRRLDDMRTAIERLGGPGPIAPELKAALREIDAKLDRQAAAPVTIAQRPLDDLAQRIDSVRAAVERQTGPDVSGLNAGLRDLGAKLDRVASAPAPLPPKALDDMSRRLDDMRAAIERLGGAGPVAPELKAALREIDAKLDRRAAAPVTLEQRPLDDLAQRIDSVRAAVERQTGPDVSGLNAGLRDLGAKLDRLAEATFPLDPRSLDDLGRRMEDMRALVERQSNPGPDAAELKSALHEIGVKLDRQAGSPLALDPAPLDDLARRIDSVRAAVERHAGSAPDASEWKAALQDLGARFDRRAAAPVPLDPRPLEDLGRRIDAVRSTIERNAGGGDVGEVKSALREIGAKLDLQAVSAGRHDPGALEDLVRRIDDVRASVDRQAERGPDSSELRAALRDIDAKLDRQHAAPAPHDPRPLEDLAQRIEDVRASIERGLVAPDVTAALRDIHERLDRQTAQAVEIDSRPLEELARRIDDMHAALADHTLAGQDAYAWEPALREISAKLDRHAISAEDSRALIGVVQELAARIESGTPAGVDVAPIESALRELSERISATSPAVADVASIERLLSGFDVKLEEVARATTDTRALEDAIQSLREDLANRPESQIDSRLVEQAAEMLAQRFEKSNVAALDTEALVNQISEIHGRLDMFKIATSSNAALERAVTELIEDLETTRQILQTTAAQPNALAPLASGIAELRAEQANSDRRMENRLFGVQGVLEKLADRLARLEDDEDRDVEEAPPPPPRTEFRASAPPRTSSAMPQAGGGGGFNLRTIPDREAGATRRAPAPAIAPRAVETPSVTIDPAEGSPARNAAINAHIAAARRAAQSAMVEHAEKAEAPAAAPRAPKPPRAASGSPFAQAGAMIARHRRPILLGATAAALTVAATVAVVELRGGRPKDVQKSELTEPTEPIAPAKTAAALDYNPTGAIETAPAKSATPNVIAAPAAAGPAKAVPGDLLASLPTTLPSALRDAASAGDVGAETEIGLRYLDGRTLVRDSKQAARWLELAANQGLPIAEYRFAALYEKGNGVARDFALARSWYLKAANAGNGRAMHNLAVLCAQDAGAGKPDYAQAAQWFRRAADLGVRDSQYNLAVLSGRGLGVSQDLGSSWLWFSLAARQGDTDAAKKRDEVQAKMDATQLAGATKALADFKAKPLDPAANEVPAPAGGWDGAPQAVSPPKTGGARL